MIQIDKYWNFTSQWNPRRVFERSTPPNLIPTNNPTLFWDRHTIPRTDQHRSDIHTWSLSNKLWCSWNRHTTLAEPRKLWYHLLRPPEEFLQGHINHQDQCTNVESITNQLGRTQI